MPAYLLGWNHAPFLTRGEWGSDSHCRMPLSLREASHRISFETNGVTTKGEPILTPLVLMQHPLKGLVFWDWRVFSSARLLFF